MAKIDPYDYRFVPEDWAGPTPPAPWVRMVPDATSLKADKAPEPTLTGSVWVVPSFTYLSLRAQCLAAAERARTVLMQVRAGIIACSVEVAEKRMRDAEDATWSPERTMLARIRRNG